MDNSEAERVVNFIRSLPDFEIQTTCHANYGHIGAVLANAARTTIMNGMSGRASLASAG
jgi:hypothetical protein